MQFDPMGGKDNFIDELVVVSRADSNSSLLFLQLNVGLSDVSPNN